MDSWETARQSFGSEEEFGQTIVKYLFDFNPAAERNMGFQGGVKNKSLMMMGHLVLGQQIIGNLDMVMTLMGPVNDDIDNIQLKGMEQIRFCDLLQAIACVMEDTQGVKWTSDLEMAWTTVLGAFDMEFCSKCHRACCHGTCSPRRSMDLRVGEGKVAATSRRASA